MLTLLNFIFVLLHSGVPVIHAQQQRPDVFVSPSLPLASGRNGPAGAALFGLDIYFLREVIVHSGSYAAGSRSIALV